MAAEDEGTCDVPDDRERWLVACAAGLLALSGCTEVGSLPERGALPRSDQEGQRLLADLGREAGEHVDFTLHLWF
ncbi:hypothetical protein [Rathayibacter rathayi]|uniref:hypothetical protein n=1 Tax=Rathayibacter rathayi TaxID=33887 RepID=UPI000BDA72F4|nr:hypothetical protein [Rathayibacter rathayi]AZZ49667.1 hypothetical protein C1O28_11130 [Rathayibacter rathayi]MWV75332.1 hypothetical protein [Rathayibacter rathayi NCPPB 2980 = VKM Ac-1601]PPF42788.1 hypothetical protein C5C08_14710 [Rathayibacter rathayi]PPG64861.1 hypothetical protein C5C16_14005 [Rathayibacter rathayi]PPG79491.1 hypothetical protein C5C15_06290 [Rathayibacter rathayi]